MAKRAVGPNAPRATKRWGPTLPRYREAGYRRWCDMHSTDHAVGGAGWTTGDGGDDRVTPELPISLLDFRLPNATDVPFEIGRLETTHRLRTSKRPHRHRFYEIIWVV